MIKLTYGLKLARTKLRSKRGMLITSVVVASLLFAALNAMVIVFSGAQQSAEEFIKKAGNDRYLVLASPNIPFAEVDFQVPLSLEQVREIKAYEKTYYENLRKKYASLGIEYDKSIEVASLTPAAWISQDLPEEQRVMMNWTSPVVEEMRQKKFEAYAKTATNKFEDLKQVGAKYNATGYYTANKSGLLVGFPNSRFIDAGKEDFSSIQSRQFGVTPQETYTRAISNSFYSLSDQKLLSRYLLTSDSENLKGIPVVVSAQEAAKLFGKNAGIGEEPKSAAEKRAWLENIQTKLNGHVYEACYRNATEQSMLEKIQNDYVEMKAGEGVEGYVKPSLLYEYPKEACGDIVVKSDVRTKAEKQAAATEEQTQKKLGTYVAPYHQLVTFQIVGIKYAQPFNDYTKSVDEYVKSLLVAQDASMTIEIPMQMYEALPDSLKVAAIQQQDASRTLQYAAGYEEFDSKVLEFKTVADARSFLNRETCDTYASNCEKKFLASPYGSNYLILDEIGKMFNKIASIAFPVVLALAGVIIWFTISRIMAENRKETAIYRAMGAKRSDVTSVYVIYVLLVALQIVVVSFVVGVIAAFAINYFYGKMLTDIAVTAFGIVDGAPSVNLFSLDSPYLWVVALSILAVSAVASVQPLIRNVMRPPVRDMREE